MIKKVPIININTISSRRYNKKFWDDFIDSFEHIHQVIHDVEKNGSDLDKEYLNGLISNYGGPKRWKVRL